jgi:hypothetical protein
MLFATNNTERARIGSNCNFSIGTDVTSTYKFRVQGSVANYLSYFYNTDTSTSANGLNIQVGADNGGANKYDWQTGAALLLANPQYTTAGIVTKLVMNTSSGGYNSGAIIHVEGAGAYNSGQLVFSTGWNASGLATERMRIDASGNVLVGKASDAGNTAGFVARPSGETNIAVANSEVMNINRISSDGELVRFRQDNTVEGNISVSGTTVSYNGGHLSRYAQTTSAKDDSLVKGTVLSNLDAMNVYTDDEGNPVPNEQLNKVKVSDTEGDVNVAGVFVNWTFDDQHNVDEINMAMTGDMIIRIAQGTTVQRGDLLMSAGDGTAKPQGDDIVRSKTVAKVTSTHITCTYEDGSYCVPCVLMAC